MNNYPAVMIDIESSSSRPNAQILCISAVQFNEFDITPNYLNYPILDILVNIDEQKERDVQQEVIDWWAKRDKKVKDKIFGDKNRISVDSSLDQLTKFIWGSERIWCQGTSFDIPILTNIYEERNKPLPWQYWQVKDVRTIIGLAEKENIEATHDSIEDCFKQIIQLQQVLKKLEITKFVK